jgi:Linalool dehydratase/isomerase
MEAGADPRHFGRVAAWASEIGDEDTIGGLLDHADRFMNPSWQDGGLYCPRNDALTDESGNRTEIEPMSGNVLLGYARLNVQDGLWTLEDAGVSVRQHGPVELRVDADDSSRLRFHLAS